MNLSLFAALYILIMSCNIHPLEVAQSADQKQKILNTCFEVLLYRVYKSEKLNPIPDTEELLADAHELNIKGAQVNGYYRTTPLLHKYASNPKIVQFLIKHGVNVNIRDESKGGITIFHKILSNEYPQETMVISVLLDAGIDCNAQDRYGYTPLMAMLLSYMKKKRKALPLDTVRLLLDFTKITICAEAEKYILTDRIKNQKKSMSYFSLLDRLLRKDISDHFKYGHILDLTRTDGLKNIYWYIEKSANDAQIHNQPTQEIDTLQFLLQSEELRLSHINTA